MNERKRETRHWLCILGCLSCFALGISNAAEAQPVLEGGTSRSDGVQISGTIRQFVEVTPMSAGTLSLYGGFLLLELSGISDNRVVTPLLKSEDAGRVEPILDFALAPATPNPSSGDVHIAWALPRPSRVRIAVLDVQGREISQLADGEHALGRYEAVWNASGTGRPNAPGIYFIRMQTRERTLVRRVVVIPK